MELDKFNRNPMSAAVQASRIQELASQGNLSPQEIRAGMAPRYVSQDEDEFDQFNRRPEFNGERPRDLPDEFVIGEDSEFESVMSDYQSETSKDFFRI